MVRGLAVAKVVKEDMAAVKAVGTLGREHTISL